MIDILMNKSALSLNLYFNYTDAQCIVKNIDGVFLGYAEKLHMRRGKIMRENARAVVLFLQHVMRI